MDLYQILLQDHREVDNLFEKIEKSGKKAGKAQQQLSDKLRQELELHTRAEEQIVYPAQQAPTPRRVRRGRK
ncbi:MAG: hemerythrin domain-containing protein [Stellaceae bacterium]